MRILSLAAALLFAVSTANAADPAAATLDRLLPADTFFYVSLDSQALQSGLPKLDLAGLFREPEVREFLRPLLSQQPGLDGPDPIAGLMKMADLGSWIAGDVALGICGATVEIDGPDGQKTRHRVSPSHPIDARLIHTLIGGFGAAHMRPREAGAGAGVSVSLDFLLSVVPGPALKQHVEQFLSQVPGIDHVQVAGQDLMRWSTSVPDGPTATVYANLSGSRWIVGGDPERVAGALRNEVRDSLATQAAFTSAKRRLTSGQNVALAYVNFQQLFEIGRGFVAPIALEEMRLWGADSLRGLAYGMSLTEGAVRDSFLVLMDEKPHGLASLVEALGAGFPSLTNAPASTLAFFGLRLDLARLRQELQTFADQIVPGSTAHLERAFRGMSAQAANFCDAVTAAIGDEVTVALAPATDGTPIPQVFTTVSLRDRGKFDELIVGVKQMLAGTGEARLDSFPITGGEDGLVVKMNDAPVQPSFAVRGNQLHGALLGALALKTYLAKHVDNDQRVTLASHNELLPKVLRGLTGGSLEPGALVYLDLRRAVPVAYQMMAPLISQAIPESGLGLDASRLPMAETLAPHFSALAFGLTRGPEGISLDAFTPLGLFPLLIGAAAVEHARSAPPHFQFEQEPPPPPRPARKKRVVELEADRPEPASDSVR